MSSKIVAIIPARGGSKRIPKKNIKLFAGKPIIAYSIKAAQESRLFDHIIVSTDSQEVTQIARNFGAEVPFIRPDNLSDDYTGTGEVILHALNWLSDNGEKVETICCLYATAPFIQPEAIKKGYETLKSHSATSVFSVTTFPASIFRALKVNEAERLEMIWPKNLNKRTQDFPEVFHDAGQFYWADAKAYLKTRRFYSLNSMPIIIPRVFVHDIDTLEDWEIAERYYVSIYGKKNDND